MSTAPPPPMSSKNRPKPPGMWEQISEGQEWDDLLKQFTADARASYGFYGKDVNWEEIGRLPAWKRPLRIAKGFFWALLMKLSAARRAFLFIALGLLLLSVLVQDNRNFFLLIAALCFLLL